MGGIGVSSAVVSFNVALYYNTIIAWCLFYFVQVRNLLSLSWFGRVRIVCRMKKNVLRISVLQSFQSQLPWAECPIKYFQNGSYGPEPECLVMLKFNI